MLYGGIVAPWFPNFYSNAYTSEFEDIFSILFC